MPTPTFEWDANKAAANLRKHGVAFEEGMTAFRDALAAIHSDPDHSGSESRAILVGHSEQGRLLLVSFTERSGKIRIISARKATWRERRAYEASTKSAQ